MLGSRIVELLRSEGLPVRALVRPSTDAAALEAAGVEIARGDLRDRDSLRAAVQGISSIVSTANTVARVMGGERGLTIGDVDDEGHASLIEEADAAGVKRFVFLSFADEILDSGTPFARAKRATE
ncbi:MAG: NAD(P)H-binding protein, partial [Chloroflexi bacterium]|nr:NAD(P)H-binding protein [Chloroflexota bacterium]